MMLIYTPAKINYSLLILNQRPDKYHQVESIVFTLNNNKKLSDIISITPDKRINLTIKGPYANGLESNTNNIILKAWSLLENTVNQSLPVKIILYKNIPHGAGLGGGSSNAAATLILGNILLNLKLSKRKLLELGAKLGSDVPIFIIGGNILSMGHGEHSLSLPPVSLKHLIIVHPRFYIPTINVYSKLIKKDYSPYRYSNNTWHNELSNASIRVCPELIKIQNIATTSGGKPLLCGSGSCFVIRYMNTQKRNKAYNWLDTKYQQYSFWKYN